VKNAAFDGGPGGCPLNGDGIEFVLGGAVKIVECEGGLSKVLWCDGAASGAITTIGVLISILFEKLVAGDFCWCSR
jgi:hypothetical protein